MGKDCSCIKIWSNTDETSQNYGPPSLLFHFTDSYLCHPYEMQNKIAIMSRAPIFKTYSKTSTYLIVWSFCDIYYKMTALSIFSKICEKCFLFGWYFSTLQTSFTYLFLFMCVICAKCNEAVANSGYTNICFMTNSPLKRVLHHFRYFYSSTFKITFDRDFMKKSCHFLISKNFLFWQP